MVLDETSLGLTLLFELTRLAKSIRERNACYKDGIILCDKLEGALTRLTGLAESIDKILRNNPETMPYTVLPDFVGTLQTVKETLQRVGHELSEYCSRAFIGSNSSGVFQKFAERWHRLVRARSLHTALSGIQRDTTEAETQLHHLLTQLCTAVKIDEVVLKSDENIRRLIEQHVIPREQFRPAFNAPVLLGNIHLDFDSKYADGKFLAPEASLKSLVFISTCPRNVAVARGASTLSDRHHSVYGASGMAGVGKTTALIGLGHDEDIQSYFIDGVLYMSIGASATDGHITNELWKIMSVTGASTRAAAARSSESLADAIAIANIWFHGKKILFLIDDMWPTSTRPEGYLPDLEGLLQGSPESRMAISTRSLEIAAKSGSHVDFGARDPCGSTALMMFLAHVFPDTPASSEIFEFARPVLLLCSGLPISISVAGAAVALRVNSGDDFEDACREYVENIQAHLSSHPGASFLESAIRLSLAALVEDRERTGRDLSEMTDYSLTELYTSLCVLENQQFAPVPVLARMWSVSEVIAKDICVSFTSMSLARTSRQMCDGREQRGLNIHDLHLDFCRKAASRRGEEKVWHRRLLSGHITSDASLNENIEIDGVNDLRGYNILEYRPRHWWRDSIPNKEYIRKNLSRHLRGAGLELELGATVLDFRWLAAQGATGGILPLKNDLDILQAAVQEKGIFPGTDEPLASLTIISIIVAGLGDYVQSGIRAINQFVHVHLLGLGESREWINRFISRMKEATPAPFLVPTVSLYRHPVEDVKLDIELTLPFQKSFAYLSTDFSPCSQYCVIGANNDVAVYNLRNRNRLKWMKGHQKDVTVVKFSSDASKLISGSVDKRVFVFDWKERDSPHLVLNGHKNTVSCLSVSEDDRRVFSGSLDGTVLVWDLKTGDLLRKITFGTEVKCVSSCSANKLIAVGTSDGSLRCMNSESGQCVFQQLMSYNAPVSAVQFSPSGDLLLCATSQGDATRWLTASWEQSGTVSLPGSVTKISFYPDGSNAILGSSEGEIRHWPASGKKLSRYNLSVAHPLNGLSFTKDGDIIVAVNIGYARIWTGPSSNPNLDFTAFRNNIVLDFDLSADGTLVATCTRDGMIRLWNTDTGTEVAAYSAPVDGSFRLALSAQGTKIASSSAEGAIHIWNPEMPPSDSDVSFKADETSILCLSFSHDGRKLLVCMESEVGIWKVDKRVEKLGQIPNSGCLDASFSADGRFVIVGSHARTSIWDATGREKVFDSANTKSHDMSISEARYTIRTCGPSAIRMWPSSFKATGDALCPLESLENTTSLTVDNIFNFLLELYRRENIQLSGSVVVVIVYGQLSIFKLWK